MSAGQSLSRRRRLLVALAAAAPWLTPSRTIAARRHDVRVIVGTDSERYREAIDALRARYGVLPVDGKPHSLLRPTRPTAYLALGAEALRTALDARLDAPVVCLFASRQAYEREAGSPSNPPSTAIHAEPAPSQQMRLISALYKRPVRVGVLVSPDSAARETSLREAAAAHGLLLEVSRTEPGDRLTRSLNRLPSVSVLLIFPDTSLYTPASLRELLESTYRRRLPVIGFSAALVAAGTLASAYTDMADTLFQLDRLLDQLGSGRLPGPRYPDFWRVAINDSVARSLDVVIDDAVRSLGDRP